MKTLSLAIAALFASAMVGAQAQAPKIPTGYEVKGSPCYRLDAGNGVRQIDCDGGRRTRATLTNDRGWTGPRGLVDGTGGGGSGAGADGGPGGGPGGR